MTILQTIKMVHVPVPQRFMKFFNLTLVNTRRLLWARCPGRAALTMGPQFRWVDLVHRKIPTSIDFCHQNLGWTIDELSHNSKAMQAKAPSMYSVARQKKTWTSSQHWELQNPVPQLYLKLDRAWDRIIEFSFLQMKQQMLWTTAQPQQ